MCSRSSIPLVAIPIKQREVGGQLALSKGPADQVIILFPDLPRSPARRFLVALTNGRDV